MFKLLDAEWKKFTDVSYDSLSDSGKRILFNFTCEIREKDLLLIGELYVQSHFDELTELGNRRHLKRRFEDITKRKAVERFGILALDVDRFKEVNDTFGHAIGDWALKRLSKEIESVLRDGDTLYRHGGEEFVITVRGESLIIKKVAERIRKHVETVEWWRQGLPNITVSIGCAEGNKDTTLDELIHKADVELYRAKKSGRNASRGLDLTDYVEALSSENAKEDDIPEAQWPF